VLDHRPLSSYHTARLSIAPSHGAAALLVLLLVFGLTTGCGHAGARRAATTQPPATSRLAIASVTPTSSPAATQPPATGTSAAAAVPPRSNDATPAPTVTLPHGIPPVAAGPNGCGVARQNGATVVESITSDGVERSYRLYIPESYNPSKPAPLVLNFHGYGSNAIEQESYSGFKAVADQAGFVLVTPEATSDPQEWFLYGPIEPDYVDDFAFIDRLIDYLEATLCIDASRVYATGISNGGGMTSLVGCRLNQRIAAIAPIAGSPYSDSDCNGQGPMPVISFHGTDDPLVPFEGAEPSPLNLFAVPVRQNMQEWAQHNGCDMTLHSQRIAEDVVLESYTNCDAGADVELYVIEGGGHTWPGAASDSPGLGVTTHSISASQLIWAFFAAHPKP
jgi:polyhydroxybutyrate depolymerase